MFIKFQSFIDYMPKMCHKQERTFLSFHFFSSYFCSLKSMSIFEPHDANKCLHATRTNLDQPVHPNNPIRVDSENLYIQNEGTQ